MRKRKLSLSFTRIKWRGLLFKLIIGVIVLFASGLAVSRARKFLNSPGNFQVKDIIVAKGGVKELAYLKGRNILEIDLKKETRRIALFHPEYKKIRIFKLLPDRLFFDFVKRKPIAYVKLYRYFCVDDERMFFDVADQSLTTGLPVILGLETKIFGPKAGRQYDVKELTLALDIIKALNKTKILKDYRIKTVNVANPANASFFLQVPFLARDILKGPVAAPIELELRIGQNDIFNKVGLLGALLIDIGDDLGKIKYIDLRFKEPVINFKNTK